MQIHFRHMICVEHVQIVSLQQMFIPGLTALCWRSVAVYRMRAAWLQTADVFLRTEGYVAMPTEHPALCS
jgi:hypothetical protein